MKQEKILDLGLVLSGFALGLVVAMLLIAFV